MIVKVFKGVWFLSLLAAVAILLYVYASLPDPILVSETAGQSVSRSSLFYIVLALLALFNGSIFIVKRLHFDHREYFLVWFYGLVISFHFFVIIALQFLNLYNSQEKFNYESIGFIIYGSIAMLVLWSSLWPAYYLLFRLFGKKPLTNIQD
jgi:hypothetical protein